MFLPKAVQSTGSDIPGVNVLSALPQTLAAAFGWGTLAAVSLTDVKEAMQILVLALSAAVSVTALITWKRNQPKK